MSGAMVPQLRFPEFVDEWDEIAFDEALVSLPTKKHQVFTTEFQKAGTFPVIDQGADFIAGYSDDASKVYSDVPIIAFGDHTTILKYVDFPFVVGADGVKLIKPKAWNAQFAYYALSAYPVEQEGYKRHFSTLRDRDISAPSIPEQQKIADFLGTVDAKLDALRQKKSGLEAFKSGLMQRLFSQELRFTRDDGTGFPDWEEKALGEMGKTFGGLSGKSGEDFGSGVPFVTYRQIFESSTVDFSKCGMVRILHGERQNRVAKGDVLITSSSETPEEVGFASVVLNVPGEVYLNSFAFGFRSGANLIPEFSRYLFRSPPYRTAVVQLAQGSTRFNISKAGFLKISLKVPHPDEQRKIADALSALDAKIAAVANQITHMESFKKGLLQQMFV